MDDYTVRVKLSEPFAPFLAVLTDRAGIMASPKAIKESGGRISKNPVGTGPFEFVERVRGGSHHRQEEPPLLAERASQT